MKAKAERHRTFVLENKVALTQAVPDEAEGGGSGDAEVLRPVKIENPMPGLSTGDLVSSYVVESDQSRGQLHMTFEHKMFGSSLTPVESLFWCFMSPM